jgi:C4-dicarboxylate transporter DctQ subunit
MWVVYLCIPLGSALMCYRFLQVMARFVKTGVLPVPTPGSATEEGA